MVENVRPGPRDLSIMDTALRGFELRVRASGTKIWAYRHRLSDGRQRRLVIGHFPGIGAAAARRLTLEAAGDVARGIDVVTRKQVMRRERARIRQSTLRAFLDSQYEPWARTHLKTADFQIARIRADFVGWMDKPMSELNTWLIEGWRKRQLEERKQPVTINRNLQRQQGVLSKAVEWNVLHQHPFSGLKPLKTDRAGRVRYLSADEEARLRQALLQREENLRQVRIRFNEWLAVRGQFILPLRREEYVDHLRPLVLLALNTGLRRGELFQLRWKDVDLNGRWLHVDGVTAKSGQTRRIPLNSEALTILETWRSQASDAEPFVFPCAGGKRLKRIDRTWQRLCKRAALQGFRFHDLRHHFASRLVQLRFPDQCDR